MQQNTKRAETARELADWFRAMASDDAAALMARAADALEGIAENDAQDVVPDVAPAAFGAMPRQLPMALNDNLKPLRRRTRH